MLISPEQITLAPFAAAAGGITGKVTQARYHGHDAPTGPDAAWPHGSF